MNPLEHHQVRVCELVAGGENWGGGNLRVGVASVFRGPTSKLSLPHEKDKQGKPEKDKVSRYGYSTLMPDLRGASPD